MLLANVLFLLHSAQAVRCVSAGGTERFHDAEGYDPRSSNVLRMLGYFSLVGLSRVHGLIGDYYTSLQALHPINPFQRKHLFAPKVAGRSPTALKTPHVTSPNLDAGNGHRHPLFKGKTHTTLK